MKLVRQVQLGYKEGRSDKVYEVDLCRIDKDQWVVNFRYGRRGTTLRDGTKTSLPVTRAKAETIFDKLVAAKRKKGYVDAGAGAADPAAAGAAESTAATAESSERAQAILRRLEGSKEGRRWDLDRVIWRAGQLRLEPAVPALLALQRAGGSKMRRYCTAWALARCATAADAEARDALRAMADDRKQDAGVRRIAREGVVMLSEAAERGNFLAGIATGVPAKLRDGDDPEALAAAIREHLESAGAKDFAILEALYLLAADRRALHAALLGVLAKAPLRPPWFRHLRHLFKAAEMRPDPEVFGLLAHRFEVERPMFSNRGWHDWVYIGGRSMNSVKELRKEKSRLAFSSRTRDYLRRRVARNLRTLGRDRQVAYVPMAVGVLLPFTDDDAQTPRTDNEWADAAFDAWAPYQALNFILYGNSPRFEPREPSGVWACTGGYQPGGPPPAVREEAFPELWDAQPRGLLHLLSDSRCGVVHEFAAKAIAANRDFCQSLDVDAVLMLVGKPYEVTIRLGLELAQERYDPADPDPRLVAGLLDAELEEARTLAMGWVDADRPRFAGDVELMLAVAISRHPDVRAWARALLTATAFAEAAAEALIARAVAHLLELPAEDEDAGALARDLGDTLLSAFPAELRRLGLGVVTDLVGHPLSEVQAFGGRILLDHRTPAVELPGGLITALMSADSAEARGIGIRLFGKLPADVLLERREVLLACCLSRQGDVRQAVLPVIRDLAAEHPDFERDLARELVPFLLREEAYEGLHADLTEIIRGSLPRALARLDEDSVWFLVASKHPAAGDLAVAYFADDEAFARLGFAQLAKLADHEILALRERAWEGYEQRRERLIEGVDDALGILDARWDDSRGFAIDYFRRHAGAEHWNPARLVSICDSVREDVSAFGRELITRFFDEADGPDYLLKLSQHPSPEMQTFATHYVERYAASDPEQLETLRHYFTAVLSRVGRGRVAKQRVLAFLRAEALGSREAAVIVGALLGHISATIAVGDKAATLEILRDIHLRWPDLELPLTLRPPPSLSREEGRHAL